jgi:hypothetical protein
MLQNGIHGVKMSKMIWDTEKILGALVISLPDAVITVSDTPGGDYDTNEIYISKGAAHVEIVGFRDLGDIVIEKHEWDLASVDWIFCCESSKNGNVNAKPADLRLCADVLEILESIGYKSVDTCGWDSAI